MAVITEEEYRLLKIRGDTTPGLADPEPESALMSKIMKFCKLEGYPAQCFRSSRKAVGFLVPGWPD